MDEWFMLTAYTRPTGVRCARGRSGWSWTMICARCRKPAPKNKNSCVCRRCANELKHVLAKARINAREYVTLAKLGMK